MCLLLDTATRRVLDDMPSPDSSVQNGGSNDAFDIAGD